MITPHNRQFLDTLTPEEGESLYIGLIEHACWRLRRYAGVSDTDIAKDVVHGAYRRLLDDENRVCWDDCPPTFAGLRRYLRGRVHDEVKNRYRQRVRRKQLATEAGVLAQQPDTPEAALWTDELKERWIEAAEDVSPALGEFVLHWVVREPGESPSVLAAKLEVDVKDVYRSIAKARKIFKTIHSEVAA